MSNTQKICRIFKERSNENNRAVSLMLQNQVYGQVVSILRQELDSMVRVIYLLQIPIIADRNHYIDQTANNIKWTNHITGKTVTDKEMVDLANNLHGWVKSVYKLGCAFIHLSSLHDYKNENPFLQISPSERNDIKQHLHDYHQFSLTDDLNMQTVTPYLQHIFKKVSDNLAKYVRDLEGGRTSPL